MTTKPTGTDMEELDLLLQELRKRNAAPLWEINAQRGRATVQPFIWHYNDYRDMLYKAAEIVPIEMA